MFSSMMDRIKSDVLERLFRVQAVKGEQHPPPTHTNSSAPYDIQSRRRTGHAFNRPTPSRQGRAKRSLPVRKRQEIQEVPRGMTNKDSARCPTPHAHAWGPRVSPANIGRCLNVQGVAFYVSAGFTLTCR